MADLLIVVDMQNDFIDGSLGTKEAEAIVENVKCKIDSYRKEKKEIIFTRDTHFENYLDTFEGKNLPVKHCIKDTNGWEVKDCLKYPDMFCIDKLTFGYSDWKSIIDPMIKAKRKTLPADNDTISLSVELCGLCTDICVLSNALLIRAFYPSMQIFVQENCCAGVTPEKHNAAIEVMKSCQITII